jgi:hypothetical protein
VITGIARAGIDALIEPPAARRRAGRTGALLCENLAGAGCGWAGRRDPQRRARLPQRDDRRAVEPVASGEETARPLPTRRGLRRRLRARGDRFDVPAWRQHIVQARQPPRQVLARPAHRRPDRLARTGNGTRSAAASTWGWNRARACASHHGTQESPASRAAWASNGG